MSTQILPIITIDPTFPSVIQDVHDGLIPSESFWLSCYKSAQPSVHTNIQAELHQVNRNLVLLESKDGNVDIVPTQNDYMVTCPALDILPTKVVLPIQEYYDSERSNPQKPQRITAFSISPDGSKFATGFLDGSVFLYPITPIPARPSNTNPTTHTTVPQVQKIIPPDTTTAQAKPHLSTVTHLQFFPSSRVLLSTGGDFTIHDLPADLPGSSSSLPDPSTPIPTPLRPARTLRGHTGTITAALLVPPSKTILSSSLDATVRIWDIPSGECVKVLRAEAGVGPVGCTCMCFGGAMLGADAGEGADQARDEGAEAGTREEADDERQTVFCGLQNGSIQQFDLSSGVSTYYAPASGTSTASITAIAYARVQTHRILVTGTAGGLLRAYDAHQLRSGILEEAEGSLIAEFRRSEARVDGLNIVPIYEKGWNEVVKVRVAIATADGLPYMADVRLGVNVEGGGENGVNVGAELVGGDCDPVKHISVRRVRSNGDKTNGAKNNETTGGMVGRSVRERVTIGRYIVGEWVGLGDSDDEGGNEGGEDIVEVWTAGDDAVVRRYLVNLRW